MSKGFITGTNEELIKAYKESRDESYLKELIEANKGLINLLVSPYLTSIPNSELEDLTSESYIPMLRAIEDYDPEQGVAFSTLLKVYVRQHLNRLYNEATRQKRFTGTTPDSLDRLSEINKEGGTETDSTFEVECKDFSSVEFMDLLDSLQLNDKEQVAVNILMAGGAKGEIAKALNITKKLELEDANFELAYLAHSGGTDGTGKYSGIWIQDVTVEDYAVKKDKIPNKYAYFDLQLSQTTGADYEKFVQLKESLTEFEKKGKEYELQAKKVKTLKKELEDAQKKAGIWVDNPYSEERKNDAYWFQNTSDADTVLRGVCGKVWKKATAPQKHATWDYTFGSGKFNRPLTGHAGGWYNKIGNKKVSLNYEGAGDEIRKMTTLIDKSEYDFDIWLQRGCGSEAIDSMLGITGFSSMTTEQLQKFIGKGGRQYNFISAGVAKGKGFSGEVICNIYAPKGTKMIYAEPFSYYSGADYDTSGFDDWDGTKKQSTFGGESEMIIQRGAYYRITKIEKSGYTTYIDMEVVLDKGYDKFQQRGAFKGLDR